MAITIVSPPSISPQPGASDSLIANGSNDSSADLSFLGLLLAQLTPAAPLALDPFAAAGKKIQSALTTEDTTGFAVTDGTASDASTLLATM